MTDPVGGDGVDALEIDSLVADRHAIRRVASLATELTDVTEVEYRQLRLERVVLVGVWTSGTVEDAQASLAELAQLAETAGSQVLDALIQRRDAPDPATFIGSGKVGELSAIVRATGADTVVADGELSPGQLRALEEAVKVKVVDRTALILDIFAQHATSREGKAQVELAQLQYMIPRLRGWGEALSRTGGGIGTRGPGETKIETDRRRIRKRVSKLRSDLAGMERTRSTQRLLRRRGPVPSVAIAGYTNAGKSSVLNRITGARVLVEDALFATLDPTVRRAHTPDGRQYTLTDTVGFVRHLPHQLVEAFRSTLEEVTDADMVLHVVDASHADPLGQMEAVRVVLAEIGAADLPELVVLNKTDLADPEIVAGLQRRMPEAVAVSARTGEGFELLAEAIGRTLPLRGVRVDAIVPYDRGDLVADAHRLGEVHSVDHEERGTHLVATVPVHLAARITDLGGG